MEIRKRDTAKGEIAQKEQDLKKKTPENKSRRKILELKNKMKMCEMSYPTNTKAVSCSVKTMTELLSLVFSYNLVKIYYILTVYYI